MFVSSALKTLGYTALMGAPPKVQPMFVSLPKESLSYTVLTGPKACVWLALSTKKKATVRFAKNKVFFFSKCYTICCQKDVKHFSIIEQFFARVKQVWLS